jgi:glutathione S-transferase
MVESNPAGDITLYWSPGSQPSRAVKAVLDIGKIQVNLKPLDVLKGESRTEEYLKINPKGQVPFIVESDFSLGESNAILKYLVDSREQIPQSLFPKDA